MRTVNFTIPKQWSDLTTDQLRFVAKLFLSEWAQIRFKFLSHALVRFSGLRILNKKPVRIENKLKYLVKKKGEKIFLLSPQQLHAVASKLEWLLDVIQEVKPLKRIMFSRMSHPRLYNTRFIQFLTAENFYIAYSETKNKKHLACLVASVYHFPWQKFNENRVKQRARKFMLCREHTLFTVFLWYSGFRWHMANECPAIFKGGGSGRIEIKEHIMGMIRGLTDGDVTKNKAVEQTDTWEALYELNAKAKHIEEMNRKLKKA